MKTLHLIRHAKSSWTDPLLADFDRPLKKRGLSDALLVAPEALAAGWRADSIYCSGAARARQTIAQWCGELHQELSHVQYRDELYTFDYSDLIDWLGQQGDNELTIVGHNPALHELIEWFSDQSLEKFPTCAYCQLQIDSDSWREISRGSARILVLLTPRMLKHS